MQNILPLTKFCCLCVFLLIKNEYFIYFRGRALKYGGTFFPFLVEMLPFFRFDMQMGLNVVG